MSFMDEFKLGQGDANFRRLLRSKDSYIKLFLLIYHPSHNGLRLRTNKMECKDVLICHVTGNVTR